MHILETERLLLRDWYDTDAPALCELLHDSAVERCGIFPFDDADEALQAIKSWNEQGEKKALVLKSNNCLIGFVGFGDMNRYAEYKELEYVISAEHRGNGYATEALRRILAFAFTETDIAVVAAWVRSFNTQSVRVLEKCAFTHEGTLRKHARDKGDTLCFSILREEWLNIHSK